MNYYLAEPYATEAIAYLRAQRGLTQVQSLGDAEALLIRSQTRVDKALLNQAPNLKFVATATSGFDHIDWRACQEKGATVCFTPEANANSTAELTIFLISALLRKTISQIENAKKNRWRAGLDRGLALEGQTLGLVGLGRVGARVAQLAKAYGMTVIAHDPFVDEEIFFSLDIERLAFIELLRAADIVSLHVPLTSETKHLINLPTLAEMQTGAYLVNVCRGEVVDESEVLVALREGRLAGAAFDVLEREPPRPGNELLENPNIIVTPHVGAFTTQAFQKASMAASLRLVRFSLGQPVPDTLPLAVPWFE